MCACKLRADLYDGGYQTLEANTADETESFVTRCLLLKLGISLFPAKYTVTVTFSCVPTPTLAAISCIPSYLLDTFTQIRKQGHVKGEFERIKYSYFSNEFFFQGGLNAGTLCIV